MPPTRIGAYGIITDQGRILLCRLSRSVREYGGQWTLPGGGLEFGEHPEEAVLREIQEETGLEVRLAGVADIDLLHIERKDEYFRSLRILYHADVVGGSLQNEADGTTDMCEWLAIDSIGELGAVELVGTAVALLTR
jgi:ADP-ribose pyrophosphatase YjhB (NUDIX family)